MKSANGQPELPGDVEKRIEEYFAWLRDRTVLKEVPGSGGYCKLTTPHLDRHNDCIEFYVRRDDGGYLLTDDGAIIADLEMNGCKLDSDKRQRLLRTTLRGFGIQLDQRKALQTTATERTFARKKHDLIQAMLTVDDMFALASPNVAGLFVEDVAAWLRRENIRFVADIRLQGQTG